MGQPVAEDAEQSRSSAHFITEQTLPATGDQSAIQTKPMPLQALPSQVLLCFLCVQV